MKILAYDPGVSTGWVIAETSGTDLEVLDFGQFVFANHVDTVRALATLVQMNGYTDEYEIVAERFDLRPGNKFMADLTPVKVNAAMNLLFDGIIYQTPAQAKALVTDRALKNLGFWPTGKTVGQPDANDVRDAARHLFYYATAKLRLTGTARRMTS